MGAADLSPRPRPLLTPGACAGAPGLCHLSVLGWFLHNSGLIKTPNIFVQPHPLSFFSYIYLKGNRGHTPLTPHCSPRPAAAGCRVGGGWPGACRAPHGTGQSAWGLEPAAWEAVAQGSGRTRVGKRLGSAQRHKTASGRKRTGLRREAPAGRGSGRGPGDPPAHSPGGS